MSVINQKEYLKKYLGIGKDKKGKKKQKKPKGVSNGLTIVDDNIDINQEIQEDLAADNDDAPQIVSIIDDRPPSLRVDEVSKSLLWTPVIGSSENQSSALRFESTITLTKKHPNTTALGKNVITSSNQKQKESNASSELSLNIKQENISEEGSDSKPQDYSPPRRRKRENSSDFSPRRAQKAQKLDQSPLRKRENHSRGNLSPLSGATSASKDNSPPRKIKRESTSDLSPRRKQEPQILDQSPPRRSHKHSNVDLSPPRSAMSGSKDISPLRRRKRQDSGDLSPKRSKESHKFDQSPQRKRRDRNKYLSPSRNSHNRGDASNRYRDNSPHKRNISRNSPDIPSCIKTSDKKRKNNRSPERASNLSLSPVQKIKNEKSSTPPPKKSSKSRWEESSDTESKLTKTLDGKKAGLQNAIDLMYETRELKKREEELFKNMSASVSGANAATVHRGKKKEVDWEAEEKKRKKEEESKEKYYAWGRGLKQVDDVTEKIKNELYEMSKPLARYADDEDLERYLKEQERAGDPMLAYFKNKRKTLDIEEGKPIRQQYEGDAPPNRFGIRPGYRWDGVDRSNGYEKEWFSVQNSKTASVEEVYKWSTEDM